MRISELSRRTGVPVATIKFYLREGLLHPGTPTGRNQACYSDVHLRRLFLIRTFTGLGEMDLATVRKLLTLILDSDVALTELFAAARRRTSAPDVPADRGEYEAAQADAVRLITGKGWNVDHDAPALRQFTQVIVALRELDCTKDVDFFEPLARAAEELSEHEIGLLPEPADGEPTAPGERAAAVARTVLLGVAMSALRRLALEDRLSRLAAAR